MPIMHIDMDCFFASCEMLRHPIYARKPLIIGSNSPRGVVSTANRIAKSYGVRSAMPMITAKRLCAHAIVLPVDMPWYQSKSQQVMDILHNTQWNMQQISIDEAYLEIPDFQVSPIYKVRQTILQQTGLTCSIGVGPNPMVSKIACDISKSFGILCVKDAPSFLKHLPIDSIPGIGIKTCKQYRQCGITTIGALLEADKFFLLDKLGKKAVEYQLLALGLPHKITHKKTTNKSISREQTFNQDITDSRILQQHIKQLLHQITEIENTTYQTIGIKIRFDDFTTILRERQLAQPTKGWSCAFENACHMLKNVHTDGVGIRLIGIKLNKLNQITYHQHTLTDFPAEQCTVS